MDFVKREYSELPIVFESDIDDKNISKMLFESPDGTVFVVDKNSNFKGIITEGDYIRYMENKNSDLKINTNCKFVYNNQDTMKEIALIHLKYKNIRTIPVLNDDNKILYAYSFELDYTKIYYEIFYNLYRFNVDQTMGIHDYLSDSKYTNIAIWGVNKISMLIGNELIKYSDIKSVSIYDSKKNQKSFRFCTFEFDNEIYWIDSIDKILDNNDIDIIIITDLSIKNYYKVKYKDLRIEFIDDIILKFISHKQIEQICRKLNKKGVISLCVSIPELNSIFNLRNSTKELVKEISQNVQKYGWTKDTIKHIFKEFGETYTTEFFKCFSNRKGMIKRENILYDSDYKSKYINCINGKRIVMNQPEIYNNSIHILGPCIADSAFVEDKYTVSSYLQNILINNNIKPDYCVFADHGGGWGYWKYNLNRLKSLEFIKGDIVILLDERSQMPLSALDLTDSFNKLYQQEDFFLDIPAHCNHKGCKVIAEEIFKYLNENYFNRKESEICCEIEKICLDMDNINIYKQNKKSFENNVILIKYLNYINKFKLGIETKKIGSIVMNCNPFTLGHRYLIETAIKEVDWLYVFIVEEDKSMFSFKNRFGLANINTKDLNNITIIPSGKFIVSAATFPGYFTKGTLPTVNIDTSTDVEIFGQYIVPALNINIRFVGNEPYDIVTNQYNRSLKEILPKYNVEVKIIERKEIDGDIVSASKVRDLLKNNKLYETKKFLSNATFEYIKKLYESNPTYLTMK